MSQLSTGLRNVIACLYPRPRDKSGDVVFKITLYQRAVLSRGLSTLYATTNLGLFGKVALSTDSERDGFSSGRNLLNCRKEHHPSNGDASGGIASSDKDRLIARPIGDIYIVRALWTYIDSPMMGQLILPETLLPSLNSQVALLIPAAAAIISLIAGLVHLVFTLANRFVKLRRGTADDNGSVPVQPLTSQDTGFLPELGYHIKGHGGGAIFAWKMLRLVACMALTTLTIVAITCIDNEHQALGSNYLDLDIHVELDGYFDWRTKLAKLKRQIRWFSTTERLEMSLCMFYVSLGRLRCYSLNSL